MKTSPGPVDPTEQAEPTVNDAPSTPAEPSSNVDASIRFKDDQALQQYVQDRLKDRLLREDKKREEAAEAARKEAEENALEQQQEFKTLADKRAERILDLEAQVGTLEQITTERDEMQSALQGYLDKERDGLPEMILSLLEGKSPVEQLAWIAANRDKLGKQNGRGIEPTPKGQVDPKLPDEERRKVAWKPRL